MEGNVSISNRNANSDEGVFKDTCSGSKAIVKDGNVVDGDSHGVGHFDGDHGGRTVTSNTLQQEMIPKKAQTSMTTR